MKLDIVNKRSKEIGERIEELRSVRDKKDKVYNRVHTVVRYFNRICTLVCVLLLLIHVVTDKTTVTVIQEVPIINIMITILFVQVVNGLIGGIALYVLQKQIEKNVDKYVREIDLKYLCNINTAPCLIELTEINKKEKYAWYKIKSLDENEGWEKDTFEFDKWVLKEDILNPLLYISDDEIVLQIPSELKNVEGFIY